MRCGLPATCRARWPPTTRRSPACHHSAAVTALAEKSGNPYLLVYGRGYSAVAQTLRGEHEAAAATLTETLAYARQRQVGLENEARLLADLAHALMHAGQIEHA